MTEMTPELKQLIETELKALKKEELLRPGMAFDDFLEEFSKLLAQVEADKAALVGAGFEFEKMVEYYGVLNLLTLIHGERVASEGDVDSSNEQFDEEMPAAKALLKLLLAAAKFIVVKSGTTESRRVYKMVRKGNGDSDALTDIVTLANFLVRYPELIKKVRPGGTVIDTALLEGAKSQALNLVDLKGKADCAKKAMSAQVDQQNRLITLALRASRDIKLYAEMAFYDRMDYYDRFYASDALRSYQQAAKGDQSIGA